MQLGDSLPDMIVNATGQQTFNLQDLKGKVLVLYFYPRDDTPGCTQQGQDFRDHYAEFTAKEVQLIGVSRDTLSKHEKFKTKYQFPFPLIADPEETLCNLFAVIKPKNMYGKQVKGIERSTFIFDKEGVLRHQWRKVSVPNHVKTVLKTLEQF